MSKSATTINLDDLLTNTITIDETLTSVGAIGTSALGDYYTATSTSIDWSNISIGTGWTATTPSTIKQDGTMELRGENADIKINGRSLMEAITKLEERLNVLVPNPELEKEWDELRELGERYRELEKKCKEKGEMWKKLKSMPPPEAK